MRTPTLPIKLLVEASQNKGKLSPDKVLELTAYVRRLYDVSHFNEGVMYQLEHDKMQLEAENRFLIKLINVKLD